MFCNTVCWSFPRTIPRIVFIYLFIHNSLDWYYFIPIMTLVTTTTSICIWHAFELYILPLVQFKERHGIYTQNVFNFPIKLNSRKMLFVCLSFSHLSQVCSAFVSNTILINFNQRDNVELIGLYISLKMNS